MSVFSPYVHHTPPSIAPASDFGQAPATVFPEQSSAPAISPAVRRADLEEPTPISAVRLSGPGFLRRSSRSSRAMQVLFVSGLVPDVEGKFCTLLLRQISVTPGSNVIRVYAS